MFSALAPIGLHRFGLGPRSGDVSLKGDDHRDILLAELDEPDIALLNGADLLSSAEIITERYRQNQLPRGYLAAVNRRLTFFVPIDRRVFETEVQARIDRAMTVKTGLVERLVTFWANHFVVETDANGTVRRTAAAFEREAIRPFVLGRFEDMLVAVTRHPAMLSYFNTASSVGPNSVIGRQSGRGCNENHARELLELHTVGVAAGYSQADVTALSKVLTGWSFRGANRDDKLTDDYGCFCFAADAHEPGSQVIMGADYQQKTAWIRAWRFCLLWLRMKRQPTGSPRSWCVISSTTTVRPTLRRRSQPPSWKAAAISKPVLERFFSMTRPGGQR